MRCVFAGTPAVAVPTLKALLASRHQVVACLTRPPARAGRGRALTPSPVHVAAREHNIPVLTPATLKGPDPARQLAEIEADVVVVVAYGLLIPAALLDVYRHGWVNLHFSLLPRWRGAAPVQHAIMARDDITGVSVFRIEEGLDTGPLLAQDPQPIPANVTTDQLLARLSAVGSEVMVAVLDRLAQGGVDPTPQEQQGMTLAPRLRPADARVDFTRAAADIEAQVRACSPKPGAWAMLGDARMKIGRVVIGVGDDLEPGQLRVSKNSVTVGTGTTNLEIDQIAAPGKRLMAAPDWARGAHLDAAARFGGTDA